MTEQICPYCNNEIRPLDKHAVSIKDAGTVIRVPGGKQKGYKALAS